MEIVAVVTDSVSCLPRVLVDKYAIRIVPISVIVDGKVYRDGVDITPTQVYEILKTSRKLPTTSSASPWDFLQAYRELNKKVNKIICITLCSDISMMYDSAVKAKQMAVSENPDIAINVVDSRNAGGAQGLVALAAARAAAEGRALKR